MCRIGRKTAGQSIKFVIHLSVTDLNAVQLHNTVCGLLSSIGIAKEFPHY